MGRRQGAEYPRASPQGSASRNILRLKIGKIAENRFGADAIREHFEDVAHANAHAANTRPAAALSRVEGDTGLARAFVLSIHELTSLCQGAEATLLNGDDPLARNFSGVGDAGANVFRRKLRIVGQNLIFPDAFGQKIQHERDPNARAFYARLSAANLWIY